jgi:hypothetical protein
MFRAFTGLLARRDNPAASPNRRRTAALRIELLENRWVPSSIAGNVYNDVNNTGLLQPGDPVYANNPISLVNAAGQQIASTVTDSNGHYVFTVDQTISTAPAVQEQDLTFGPNSTDAPQSLQISQFDPSLGTLTGVEIDQLGTVTSNLKVDNLDPAQATVQAHIEGAVTLQGSGFSPVVANVQADESATLSASDGTIGFNGAAAFDFGPKDAQGTQSVTLDAATQDLSAFIGTGQTTVTETGTANVNLSGPANLLAMIQSTVSGRVKVVYHYTPSNALKPGQYTVVQTANPPGTTDGVNSSNGVPVPPSTPADTIPVTLPPGGDSLHNDFGELTAASVAGFVYLDANQNGQFDPGDSPIPNAVVTISGPAADGVGVVSQTAVTGADGSYSFTVPPGNYTITQPVLAGLIRGATTPGSLGGTAPAPGVLTVGLPAGANGVNYDFGYVAQPDMIPPPIPPAPPQLPPVAPDVPPATPPIGLPMVTKFDFLASTAWDGEF